MNADDEPVQCGVHKHRVKTINSEIPDFFELFPREPDWQTRYFDKKEEEFIEKRFSEAGLGSLSVVSRNKGK